MCIAFVVVSALGAAAFGATARIQGTVTASGKAIGNAFILIHDYAQPSPSISQNYELTTAQDGSFTVNVTAGCYDIFVSAAIVKPHTRRVCVNEGETKRLRIKPGTETDVRLPIGE